MLSWPEAQWKRTVVPELRDSTYILHAEILISIQLGLEKMANLWNQNKVGWTNTDVFQNSIQVNFTLCSSCQFGNINSYSLMITICLLQILYSRKRGLGIFLVFEEKDFKIESLKNIEYSLFITHGNIYKIFSSLSVNIVLKSLKQIKIINLHQRGREVMEKWIK